MRHFGMWMVFTMKLAMMKMYQVQNVYIVDINLGSLRNTESNR